MSRDQKVSAKKNVKRKSEKSQKTVSEADLVRKIREEVWPVERSVLYRPERLKYVRKLIKPEGCVFCEAIESGVGVESLLLYSGDHAIVIMNKYPYNNGHLLILPKRHCGDFLKLTEVEHREMNACLTKAVQALTEVYQPSGFNIGLNLGLASGAGIPEHLHYHVVPRWTGDTNFFPLIADTKVVVETLEQSHKRLLPYFSTKKKKPGKKPRGED